jgi:hypothetical protein
MHHKTLVLKEEVLGKRHPDTLTSVYWLAFLAYEQNIYEDALSLYERACAGYQATLGLDHLTQAFLEQYASAEELLDKQTPVSRRAAETQLEFLPSDCYDSSTVEMLLRPNNQSLLSLEEHERKRRGPCLGSAGY